MKHYPRLTTTRASVLSILAVLFVTPMLHSAEEVNNELPYTLYDDDPFGGGVKIYCSFEMESVKPELIKLIESEVRSNAFFMLLSLETVPENRNLNSLNIDVSVSTKIDVDELPAQHLLSINIDEDQYANNPPIAERVYYYVMQRIYGFSQGLCFAGLKPNASSIFLGIPDEAVERTEQGYIIHDVGFHVICLPHALAISPPSGRLTLLKRDNQELDPAMHQAISEVSAKIAQQYRHEGRPLPNELDTFDLRTWHRERNGRVANLLAEDHDLVWQSPTDLNSYGLVWRHPTVLLLLDVDPAEGSR